MGTFYHRMTEAKARQLLAGDTLEIPVAGERFRLGDFSEEMIEICRGELGGTVTASHEGLGAVSRINLRVVAGDRPEVWRTTADGQPILPRRRGLRRLIRRRR